MAPWGGWGKHHHACMGAQAPHDRLYKRAWATLAFDSKGHACVHVHGRQSSWIYEHAPVNGRRGASMMTVTLRECGMRGAPHKCFESPLATDRTIGAKLRQHRSGNGHDVLTCKHAWATRASTQTCMRYTSAQLVYSGIEGTPSLCHCRRARATYSTTSIDGAVFARTFSCKLRRLFR